MNHEPPTIDEKEAARALAEALDGKPLVPQEVCKDELEIVGLLNSAFRSDLKDHEVELQWQRVLKATSVEPPVTPWWRIWLVPLGTAASVAGLIVLVFRWQPSLPAPTQLPVPSTELLLAESKRTMANGSDFRADELWEEYDASVMNTLLLRYREVEP
ncbi:MAG: hypothetical protein HUU55_04495 [Myxococcales bacterium]|nr:hypothetical protein [Myxococcales bacterium]